MIKLTGIDGRTHYLSPAAIAKVSQPSPSAAWHGIRAIVEQFDGSVLEVRDEAGAVASRINAAVIAQKRNG